MNPAPSWRPVRQADISAVARMAKPFYRHEHLPFDESVFRLALGRLIRDPRRGRAWLILSGRSVAGYVAVCRGYSIEYGGDTAVIDEFYIEPRLRGKGLGSATLAFLQCWAARSGLVALQLEVVRGNERAARLYKRSGFADTGRILMRRFPSR